MRRIILSKPSLHILLITPTFAPTDKAAMKKLLTDLTVLENLPEGSSCTLLKLRLPTDMPTVKAGQFAQIRIDQTPGILLRRPISICWVDRKCGELWFLVRRAGKGTQWLADRKPGDRVNAILPLGNGFTVPASPEARVLLVGGGVGCAPMLCLGRELVGRGLRPTFLVGARTYGDLLLTYHFRQLGILHIATDDGSLGHHGVATTHPIMHEAYDMIYACGPKPMMMAVAREARSLHTPCEVSLENVMACGLGACLCCVENTTEGHVCVCKEGPVFNTDKLLWQI